ncbi:MAG: hypothetical protein AAGA35_03400 [Patescibacteria group bacterium]
MSLTRKHSEFVKKLKIVCEADTSANPGGWTEDNPMWGHCAVVAVLAQGCFGGRILKGSLKEHEKYAYLRSHFWNELPDGKQVDFTAEQYPDLVFTELKAEERSRENILSHPDSSDRFGLLKQRFKALA